MTPEPPGETSGLANDEGSLPFRPFRSLIINQKGIPLSSTPLKSNAEIFAAMSAMRKLGRTVKSDHLFVPEIIVGGIDPHILPLHFHRVEVPVVVGIKQECKVSILGTYGLASRAIAEEMKRCEHFNATSFLGMQEAHHGSIELNCRFVRVNPVEFAWDDQTKLVDIEVVLEMEAIAFGQGNVARF